MQITPATAATLSSIPPRMLLRRRRALAMVIPLYYESEVATNFHDGVTDVPCMEFGVELDMVMAKQ